MKFNFKHKKCNRKSAILLISMIGGTILIGVGGGLSLMLLDQNSSKRTNINDLSFNTQLKIQVFEPSANLLTEDFKQINNNVLSIWDGIHFFWSELSSTSAKLTLDATNSKIYYGTIYEMACRIPLMEPIDINTINFENNLLGVEYKYDDDDSLTLAFQNTNVESVIDWNGIEFTWSDKSWNVNGGNAHLTLSTSNSPIYEGTILLECSYTDLDVIPENKMIFSSNNSEIVGFNTNIFEYHKFVVPVKHNDVLVTTLATDLFRNNESLSIINLQNVEKFSDSLGGAFTGCSNITEISIASDNVNLQLWNGNDNAQTTITDGFVRYTTDTTNTITSVGGLACGNIVLPDNITTIEEDAFSNCVSLKTLNLNRVASIGNRTFENCSSLNQLSLNVSILNMGDSVFENCLNVSSLTFTNFNTFPTTEWGNDLFSGWKNNGEIRATGGMATSQNALDFAQNKGLPRSWTPIT